MAKKKRTQLEIIHDMLQAVHNKGGSIKPTHLLYRSNLSYKLLQEYVEILKGKGMLDEKETKGKKQYAITEKGLQFLFEYRRMMEFTNAFGL